MVMRKGYFSTATALSAAVLVLMVGFLAGCGIEGSRLTASNASTVGQQDTATNSLAIGNEGEAALLPNAGAEPLDASVKSNERGSRQVDAPYSYQVLGLVIFTYHHYLDFTYNGLQVTSVTRDNDGAFVRNNLWTYTHYGSTFTWGPGHTWYYSEQTGLFERHLLSPTGLVVQRVRVTIWIRAYGGGSYQTGTRVW
jgi:hypothetical protein